MIIVTELSRPNNDPPENCRLLTRISFSFSYINFEKKVHEMNKTHILITDEDLFENLARFQATEANHG